ncbi:MAG: hypothetical protein AAFO94_05845 [Bacteroidota bacterium]
MLLEEAQWLGNELLTLSHHFKQPKLLNVGSGTTQKTVEVQSHQEKLVLQPLRSHQVQTVNTDIEAGEGVDLVGDLTDLHFLEVLKAGQFNLVTCNNLLEHIDPIAPICNSFKAIVPQHGYLVVTVPYRYPYHPDPIDTMFRPSVRGIATLIDGFEVVKGDIINGSRHVYTPDGELRVERNYFQTLMNDKAYAVRLLLRSLLPFYKFKNWWNTVRYWPHLFSSYKVTCVVLRRV